MRVTKLKSLLAKSRRRKLKKKRSSLYAKIDWKKVESLFQRPANTEKDHKYPPVRDVLRVIAAAGAIGMIFAFPASAPAVGLLFGVKRYPRWQVNQVVQKLAKQKYLTIAENEDKTTTVKITKSGFTHALTYELDTMRILKPKKWDKKWRVIIFDILEKYKDLRDVFRMRLVQLGLYQLQESVYVSPYPCFDEVEFLRELYGVSFTTKYLLVEKIEEDSSLRIHFGLSS